MNKLHLSGAIAALILPGLAGAWQQTPTMTPPATAAPTQEVAATYSLKRVAKAGDVLKFKLGAELEMGGQNISFSALMTETVKEVADNGNYKIASGQTDAKINMGGQEQDIPSRDADNEVTYTPLGEIVDVKADGIEGARRFGNLQILRAPDSPVKVGDSWTYKGAADAKAGVVAFTADYKVLAAEKVGDLDTIKLKCTIKETEGAEPASSDGTVWVEAKNFSMVKVETTWTNMPVPGAPGPINAKVTITRV
ncbi:MAG: hypothetical protein HYR64_08540 [Fimbriimonas ginsengisoli]|uniref:Uncharacterized protein n=1 Tax=Fimbriimonas ginsengisoli TaxID=1005039 RepID=A0A931PV12_FIMGI|nr:hypothetical protein [Fimbriimonas ginsengisoli]